MSSVLCDFSVELSLRRKVSDVGQVLQPLLPFQLFPSLSLKRKRNREEGKTLYFMNHFMNDRIANEKELWKIDVAECFLYVF